jgi:MFS family permease
VTRDDARVTALVTACHSLIEFYMLVFPAVLGLMASGLGVGIFQVSVLGNIAYFAYGLGALPSGFLTDRFGARPLLTIAVLGTGISSVLIGLAPNYLLLGFFMLCFGLSASLYHPAGLSFLSWRVKKTGKAMGYHGMGGNVGAALAPLLAGTIAHAIGWRGAYMTLALPGLALGGLLAFSSFGEALDRGGSKPQEVTREGEGRQQPVLLWALGLIYLASILIGLVYRGTLTFLPLHLSESVGMSILGLQGDLLGSYLTTAALLIGVVAQYWGGAMADRSNSDLIWVGLMVLFVPSLVLIGSATGPGLIGATIAFIFLFFGDQPVGNLVLARFTPLRLRGLGFGFSFFFAFGMGSFATSIAGWVAENLGLSEVFYVMAAIGAAGAALAAILVWQARRVGQGSNAAAEDGDELTEGAG